MEDHAPRRVAADLGVVAEAGDHPADLVAVLDQRLAHLQRHRLGQLVGAGLDPVGDLVQQLAAVHRQSCIHSRDDSRAAAIAAPSCSSLGALTVAIVCSVKGFDLDPGAVAGDELAADRQDVSRGRHWA